MAKLNNHNDIASQATDIYIKLVLISFLGYVSFTLVSPFITVILWASVLAISLYPFYTKLTARLGNSKKISALSLAVLGLIFLLIPTAFLIYSAVHSSTELIEGIKSGAISLPLPKESIQEWPLIGENLYKIWSDAHVNLQKTLQGYLPEIKTAGAKIIAAGKAALGGILQFSLSIIFASIFMAYAQPLSKTIKQVAKRLNNKAGTEFVNMAVATTRNVAKGILGIAIFQGGLASIGLLTVGIPFAGLWAAATVVLSLVQVPMLIILPAIVYIWATKSTVIALVFTAYMIPVMISDNFLKPILMTKGLTSPMFVVLIGVIGGTVSFGILGLFIGPVILAIFYDMVRIWVAQTNEKTN